MGKYDKYVGPDTDRRGKSSGSYDEPGVYWQLITAWKEKPRAAKAPGNHSFSVIIEKVILRAFEGSELPIGKRISQVTRDSNFFFGDIMQSTVAGIVGCSVEEVTVEDLEEAAGPEQPLCGIVVLVEVSKKEREGKDPITQVDYMGRVPWSEVAEHVNPELLELHFPEGLPSDEG